jgi:hypothetical protein
MLERLCYGQAMKKKAPAEVNKPAAFIVDQATNEEPELEEKPMKNQAAVELGRLGGLKGGKARNDELTPERRLEIAKNAAAACGRNRSYKSSPGSGNGISRVCPFLGSTLSTIFTNRFHP